MYFVYLNVLWEILMPLVYHGFYKLLNKYLLTPIQHCQNTPNCPAPPNQNLLKVQMEIMYQIWRQKIHLSNIYKLEKPQMINLCKWFEKKNYWSYYLQEILIFFFSISKIIIQNIPKNKKGLTKKNIFMKFWLFMMKNHYLFCMSIWWQMGLLWWKFKQAFFISVYGTKNRWQLQLYSRGKHFKVLKKKEKKKV